MQDYWNNKFDELNEKHWDGKLKKIPVTVMYLADTWGEYSHPSSSYPETEQEIMVNIEHKYSKTKNIFGGWSVKPDSPLLKSSNRQFKLLDTLIKSLTENYNKFIHSNFN